MILSDDLRILAGIRGPCLSIFKPLTGGGTGTALLAVAQRADRTLADSGFNEAEQESLFSPVSENSGGGIETIRPAFQIMIRNIERARFVKANGNRGGKSYLLHPVGVPLKQADAIDADVRTEVADDDVEALLIASYDTRGPCAMRRSRFLQSPNKRDHLSQHVRFV